MSKCAYLSFFAALMVSSSSVLAQQVGSDGSLLSEYKAAAQSAEQAAAAKRIAVDRLAIEVERLKAGFGTKPSAYLRNLEERLSAYRKAADEADKQAFAARGLAQDLEGANRELAALGRASPAPPIQSERPEPRTRIYAANCSLDTPEQRRTFEPGECLNAKTGASQGATSLPDRVVDRKGVTATLGISGDSSKASIKFANAHNLRFTTSQNDASDFRQRRVTVGYNVGLQTTNVTNSDGRIYGLAEKAKSRSLRELDRLDEKVSITGGISLNGFPSVAGADLERSVAKFVETARAACDASKRPRGCNGNELIAWIDEHPEYLRVLEDIYWGTGQKIAKWGLGLQGELGRPTFEYFPFETVTIADPLEPGETKTVVDLSRIPSGFPGNPERKVRHPFSLSFYGFRHFPVTGRLRNRGITAILSGTWKRSYAIADERTGVIICPTPGVGSLATNENCRTVNVAAPAGKNESFVAGEVRTLFDGWWIVPSFGLAPKFTYQIDGSRKSLDVPVYVSADKEGMLNGGLRFKLDFSGQKDGVDRKNELLVSLFFNTNFDLTPK